MLFMSSRRTPRIFLCRLHIVEQYDYHDKYSELFYYVWEEKMEPAQIAFEVNKLSLPQKLILAQDIWDSISRDSGKLTMPEWQKNEVGV